MPRAFQDAVDLIPPADSPVVLVDVAPVPPPTTPVKPAVARATGSPVTSGRGSIDHYSQAELRQLVRWVRSDGLLHTNQEIVTEVTRDLGFDAARCEDRGGD